MVAVALTELIIGVLVGTKVKAPVGVWDNDTVGSKASVRVLMGVAYATMVCAAISSDDRVTIPDEV